MDFIVLLQPLLGKSFRLRQCQKTPVIQENRSEDAVEALDIWILPRDSWINIVVANPMVQEPFSLGGLQTHYRCHCAGNPAEFVHYRQKFQRLAIFRPLKDQIIASHMVQIRRFRYFPGC